MTSSKRDRRSTCKTAWEASSIASDQRIPLFRYEQRLEESPACYLLV